MFHPNTPRTLSTTELDAVVGGTTASSGTGQPAGKQNQPALLVVIAIIAILIG